MDRLWLALADPDPATNGRLIYSKGLIEAASPGWPVAPCDRPRVTGESTATRDAIALGVGPPGKASSSALSLGVVVLSGSRSALYSLAASAAVEARP